MRKVFHNSESGSDSNFDADSDSESHFPARLQFQFLTWTTRRQCRQVFLSLDMMVSSRFNPGALVAAFCVWLLWAGHKRKLKKNLTKYVFSLLFIFVTV